MRNIILFKICLIFMSFSGAAESKQTVILLYGRPGSGKTTTRKYLQALSPLGFLFVGLDLFIDQLPMFFGRDKNKTGISDDLMYFPQYDKYMKMTLKEGKMYIDMPDYDNYFGVRFDLFDLLLARGNNIAIEEPGMPFSGDLGRYFDKIDPKKVDFYAFKLEITPRIVYERLINRDGMYVSFAFSDEEPDLQWDLVIQVDSMSPREVAETIMEYIKNNKPVFTGKVAQKNL